MEFNKLLNNYANLTVNQGVNLKENDTLLINCPISCADFGRQIAEIAYKKGAKDVVLKYNDEKFNRIRLLNAPLSTLEEIPEWVSKSFNDYAKEDVCVISIYAEDPDAYKGVPTENISTSQKARMKAIKPYYDAMMINKLRWCVVSVPTEPWAKKIFPDISTEEAIEKLWKVIFNVVRADNDDPVKAWGDHVKEIKNTLKYLNSKKFKTLHYTNSLGTDFKVELHKNHKWLGGSEKSSNGTEFNANIPTEEVFTLPVKSSANGKVVSSKPLIYGGNLINNFSLTFKDGKVVDFTAEEGYEALKDLLTRDKGSSYLGEVALVPYDSPISNSNLTFFNTLFDENAACHLALGNAYPTCYEGAAGLSDEELTSLDINVSLEHEDFMIGTSDLSIVGTTFDGEEIQIFKDGNFNF
ncbi:MAG: aminopeptidase [Clostridium sp.]